MSCATTGGEEKPGQNFLRLSSVRLSLVCVFFLAHSVPLLSGSFIEMIKMRAIKVKRQSGAGT